MFAVEIMPGKGKNPKTGELVSKLRARMSNGEILGLITGDVVDGKFVADSEEKAIEKLKSRFSSVTEALRHVVVREKIFSNEDGTERNGKWATISNIQLGESLSW